MVLLREPRSCSSQVCLRSAVTLGEVGHEAGLPEHDGPAPSSEVSFRGGGFVLLPESARLSSEALCRSSVRAPSGW